MASFDAYLLDWLNGLGLKGIWNGPISGPFQMAVAYGDIRLLPYHTIPNVFSFKITL